MSRKVFDRLSDVFSDIASRKKRAAQARFSGSPKDVEHSSEVYANSCARIAAAFEDQGFKYAKSGPHFSKRTKNFTYIISLQTSHHNIPGEHVVLMMAANVKSPLLKKWRNLQRKPYRHDDWIAGGLVHLLEDEHTFVEWELADPKRRYEVIKDVIGFISNIVLPYFERFKNPRNTIEQLIEKNIPAFDLASSIEFVLCFGGKEQAQEILNRFIKERPDLNREIKNSYRKFKENGFPNHHVTVYADQVAWLRLAHDLD